MDTPLNPRRTRFVQEYLVDGNGTAAAVRAGFARAGAHVTSSRLLRDPKVAAALLIGQKAVAKRLDLSREMVLQGILDAVAVAQVQGNAAAQIAGWREIGRVLGYYAPEVRRVQLSTENITEQARLEAMSDEELLAIMAVGQAP